MPTEDELAYAIRECPPGETGAMFREYFELIDGSLGGTSALVFACYVGRHDVARAIAQRRAKLQPFEAAAIGDVETLKLLIAADPACMEEAAPDGFLPLGLACFFKQEAAVRLLLEAGAPPYLPSRNASRVAPLHSAVAARHAGIVALLLEYKAPVNAAQQNGFTPLMAAAHLGDGDIVDLLLAHGADSLIRDDNGKLAAHHARASGHQALAERLAAADSGVD